MDAPPTSPDPTPPASPSQDGPPSEDDALAPDGGRAWTILGRLSKAVREQNWFAVGLELVIVVAGVLIALAANDWADARQARQVEIESLRELRTALNNDLPDIRYNLGAHERATSSAALLREHIRARQPYADTLDAHFANILVFTYSIQDEAAYETLKQRGMETVTDDSLRAAIGHVYGVEWPNVTMSQEWVSDYFQSQQVPFYHAHFRDIRFFESATPTDYDALLASPEFAAMLDFLILNHAITADRIRALDADVSDVLAQLDRELADR